MICRGELSVEKVVSRIVELIEEDEEEGMRPKEISERMNMKLGILEPFIKTAVRAG